MSNDVRDAGHSVARVRAALAVHGLADRIRTVDASTRTAADAARVIGCTVAQIAKSVVFKADDGAPVVVVASGDNRVDEGKVAAALGRQVGKADAAFVRAATGFAIGGVSPAALPNGLVPLIDRDLLSLGDIWAAAGSPHAVFRLTANELLHLTGGTIAEIAARLA